MLFFSLKLTDSLVGSLIGSASQKRDRSKPQKRDRSKPQYWEYYRFRNDPNIGYISHVISSAKEIYKMP